MRPLNPTIYETLSRSWGASTAAAALPSTTSYLSPVQQLLQSRNMASTYTDLGIENTQIKTASGVELDGSQKAYVGCILDLMAGRPSLKKLSLWKDDAVFEDPLTIAKGRDQYQAQWYGLDAAFSKIERLNYNVTSSSNPITVDLENKYTVKGLGTEKTISSVLKIHWDEASGKIAKVEDRWNGELPTGKIAEAFRRLNAVTVPKIVSVPKSESQEASKEKPLSDSMKDLKDYDKKFGTSFTPRE